MCISTFISSSVGSIAGFILSLQCRLKEGGRISAVWLEFPETRLLLDSSTRVSLLNSSGYDATVMRMVGNLIGKLSQVWITGQSSPKNAYQGPCTNSEILWV